MFFFSVEGEKNLSGSQEAQDLVSKVGLMATVRDSDCCTCMPECTLQTAGQWSQNQGLGPPFLVAARLMAKMVEG